VEDGSEGLVVLLSFKTLEIRTFQPAKGCFFAPSGYNFLMLNDLTGL
jgi:hypothetical protein